MKFALIESLDTIRTETDQTAQYIMESVLTHPDRDVIIESADSVLGILAAKLKAGKPLQPAEVDEYAQLYASLSLLAQNSVRHGYNIDIATPEGKAKFGRIVSKVGEDQAATENLKKVANVNGQSHLKQIRTDLGNFPAMDPAKQQIYINSINKLRLSYERVKNQLSAAVAAPAAPMGVPA
jgi:hypothetical protein